MRAPTTEPAASNSSLTKRPKRDELWLRTVFALPIASSTGPARSSDADRSFIVSLPPRERYERYRVRCLFVSVLPAPDSPETTSDCDVPRRSSAAYAASAIAYACGGSAPSAVPLKRVILDSPYSGSSANGLSARRIEPVNV